MTESKAVADDGPQGSPMIIRSNSKKKVPADNEHEQIHLQYLDCRGRLEPVLLLLEDAGAAYSLDNISLVRWRKMQKHGQDRPPRFPFNVLPTLEQGIAHDGRSNIFSETGAILRFLQAELRAPDMSPMTGTVPIATARHDMILDASLCFCGTFLNLSTEKDWLSAASLSKSWRELVKPYLAALDFLLQDDLMPPIFVPLLPPKDARPGTMLGAAAVSAAYSVELVASLYGRQRIEAEYAACTRLRNSVYDRPRVATWLQKSGQLERPRICVAPWGTYDLVEEAARAIETGGIRIEW